MCVASFTLSVLGFAAAAAGPAALYASMVGAGSDDATPGMLVAIFAIVAVPIVAIVLAGTGTRRVRKSPSLKGAELGIAATVLSVLAVIVAAGWLVAIATATAGS
jgi:chromate transport protein ChrA